MSVVLRLDKAITEAGVGIFGVSIGDPSDKNTWRVDYRSKPTSEIEAQVASIISKFDTEAPEPPSPPTLQAQIAELAARITTLELKK